MPPADDKKSLHTSCRIEKCKDYSQFIRFYHCKSKMIPFSSLEISLASRNCGVSREEMLYEMERQLGCSLEETQRLLQQASYAQLYPRIKRDAIISYGIVHHMNLTEINDILQENCRYRL